MAIIKPMAKDEIGAAALEETPTSYNSKGQAVMMVGIALLLLILITYSVTNTRKDREAKDEVLVAPANTSNSGGLSSTEKFDKQVDDKRRQLKGTQYDAREERKAHIIDEGKDIGRQQNFLIDQLTQQSKSAKQSWEDSALVRIRESRFSGFGFNYYDEKRGNNTNMVEGIHPVSNTDHFIQQENARIKQLQTQLETDISQLSVPINQFQTADGSAPRGLLSTLSDNLEITDKGLLNVVGLPASELDNRLSPDKLLLNVGAVFTASLDQKVISDYVGPYRAIVNHNVTDVSARFVLIPAGSRIVGDVLHVNNVNPAINRRMGLTINWIIRPDGSKVMFRTRALDSEGVGAIAGSTNYHLLTKLGGVAAFALLSRETERSDFSSNGQGSTFASDVGTAFREQGAGISQSFAGVIPTQTLHQGTALRFLVSEDIYIVPWRSVFSKFVSNF